MKMLIHINSLFPKHLFWDVDMSALDIENDRDLIIPRALIASTALTFVDDISKLEQLYSKASIARELKETKERISNQICRLVARRYHVKQFARFDK
jgi:hypothetical protein